MKKILISVAIIFLAVTVIPFLIVINFSGYKRESRKTDKFPDTVSVYIKAEDKVCDMNVNQYLSPLCSPLLKSTARPRRRSNSAS